MLIEDQFWKNKMEDLSEAYIHTPDHLANSIIQSDSNRPCPVLHFSISGDEQLAVRGHVWWARIIPSLYLRDKSRARRSMCGCDIFAQINQLSPTSCAICVFSLYTRCDYARAWSSLGRKHPHTTLGPHFVEKFDTNVFSLHNLLTVSKVSSSSWFVSSALVRIYVGL